MSDEKEAWANGVIWNMSIYTLVGIAYITIGAFQQHERHININIHLTSIYVFGQRLFTIELVDW